MKRFIFFIFTILFFFLIPKSSSAANFSLSSLKKEVDLNSFFQVEVNLNTKGEKINAMEAKLNFDPEKIQVISLDTANSIFSLFIQKDFDNEKGVITVIAGLPSPGFSGSGQAFTINLKAVKKGESEIDISSASKILNNDKNNNIFEKSSSLNFSINSYSKTEPQTNGAKSNRQLSNSNQYFLWLIILSNLLTFLLAMMLNMIIIKKIKKRKKDLE